MSSKDPEKMVLATAKAMAWADIKCCTPAVVRQYADDARHVLIETLKAAKRRRWTVDELLLELDSPKPKVKPWEKYQDPPRPRSGP